MLKVQGKILQINKTPFTVLYSQELTWLGIVSDSNTPFVHALTDILKLNILIEP